MNFPCNTPPLDCPADGPLIPNISSEIPDERLYFGYRYFLDYSTFCQSTNPDIALLCAPQLATIYTSSSQTCTISCGGPEESYTVPAGAFLSLVSQADADLQAYNLACAAAAIVCAGGILVIYTNTAQSCALPCAMGSSYSYTTPAGSFSSVVSQQAANLAAFQFACDVADILCPIPGSGGGAIQYANTAQTCTISCGSGGEFTYLLDAGLFVGASLEIANAIANSYACQQAVLAQSCLGDIQDRVCVTGGIPYADTIATNLPGTITWSVTSGTLPTGLTFVDGYISGVATVGGAYSFTVKALSSNGNYATRTYTIYALQITTASLADGVVGVAYSQTLTQTGAANPHWVAGTLPNGLTLDGATGVISGVPTSSEDAIFSVFLYDGDSPIICSRDYELIVSVLPMEWWKMDEAGSNPRIGAVNGLSLDALTNASSVAGVVNNATDVSSTTSSIGTITMSGPSSTGLGYGGIGISMVGWIKTSAAANQTTNWQMFFSSDFSLWRLTVSINQNTNQLTYGVYDADGILKGGTTVAFVPSGAYQFFWAYYNPSSNTVGITVNDGAALSSSSAVSVTMPVSTKGRPLLQLVRNVAGTGNTSLGQFAVYPVVLNAGQVTYIYNAGTGRAWPITLPP